MKTRLPKALAAALLAALTTSGIHAEALTGSIEKDAAFIVSNGETVYIGDGVTETTFKVTGPSEPTDVFIVDGGSVIINKADFTSMPVDTQLWIGYEDDRAGHMVVSNGSSVDIHTATTLGLYNPESSLTIKEGSTFTGGYNNLWMYAGTINIDGTGSRLNVNTTGAGYNYRALIGLTSGAEATINITNGAELYSAATQFITNFRDDTTVNIRVDGKGSRLVHAGQTEYQGGYPIGTSGNWVYKESGADIPAKRESGWYDADTSADVFVTGQTAPTITYLCDGGTDQNGRKWGNVNNSFTNISATNGGSIEFNSSLTYIGGVLDRSNGYTNKGVTFTIGEGSSVSFNRLEIYADTTINNSGSLIVNGNLALHNGVTLTLNLTEANADHEIITLADDAQIILPDSSATAGTRTTSTGSGVTIVINTNSTENKKAGSNYVLFNKEVDLSEATVIGTGAEVTIVNGETVLTLLEDIYVGRSPLADVLGAAAWGVQKSSQAFTGTLWGGRTNAVILNTSTHSTTDNKGNLTSFTEPVGQTIAWGTAYGAFDRLSNCGSLTGADYSIYGAAMGMEHQFMCGSSIGAAIGYDWGKVSPFNAASMDQESMHAAVYGRAGQWKAGQKGALALDLSAAVGSTETELPADDIEQDSLQLDARVSYIHSITDQLAASLFAGVQYYAQEDAAGNNAIISSMQSLRTMVGASITYAVTARSALFAEASVHNDAMRHNPVAEVDGFREQVASPGRLGGSITAGAAHQLNDNWTLRGSYSFEGAEHSTEHSVNAGAVYRF